MHTKFGQNFYQDMLKILIFPTKVKHYIIMYKLLYINYTEIKIFEVEPNSSLFGQLVGRKLGYRVLQFVYLNVLEVYV